MFIYENGLPVGFSCSDTWECRNGCVTPEICGVVEEHMLAWFRSLPGQPRRRLGKVGIMQGQEVNLNRLENE